MVKVCDAVMGTGKTSAAVTYMNEHPDQRFIYITPYLPETKRIVEACRNLHFYTPRKLSEYKGSKTLHSEKLIREGRNIATTHEAFRRYSPEMTDLIRDMGYTAIIDENIEIMQMAAGSLSDIQMVIDAGYVKEASPDEYELVSDVYKGGAHDDLFRTLRTRNLMRTVDKDKTQFYYWILPPGLLTAFQDVFILTYMFAGQGLHHLVQMADIPYQEIGVHYENGVYRFSDTPNDYVPAYLKTLPEKIHILDNDRMNAIGKDYYDLSINNMRSKPEKVGQLKRNLDNYFNNIHRGSDYDRRLWSAYKDYMSDLRGKGYANCKAPFNERATNSYKDRNVLAYCVNLFMNVGQKTFYESHGVDVDEDVYALSTMVQWIWRSAIRDGKEIDIYIPSARMRGLLEDWIETVSTGGEVTFEQAM